MASRDVIRAINIEMKTPLLASLAARTLCKGIKKLTFVSEKREGKTARQGDTVLGTHSMTVSWNE